MIDSELVPELYFARQIVTNACATQAILSILLNSDKIQLGPLLQQFKEFTSSFDSESRGLAIGNSDEIRTAHNSFARPEPFLNEESRKVSAKDAEDVYHFVAYIPHQGRVYELDGLKSGPILLGDFQTDLTSSWWSVAKPAIEARMARYASTETHFALLSVCAQRSFTLVR